MKLTFKMWRASAKTDATAVARIYEYLAENYPQLKKIIRKQLIAEYGVDPFSSDAQSKENAMPTPNEIEGDFTSPDMIFYPEEPLKSGENPEGCSVRGSVGHNVMYAIPLSVYEGRVLEFFEQYRSQGLFAGHTDIFMAFMEAGIAQNTNDEARDDPLVARSEMRLRNSVFEVERRVNCGETFFFVPLEPLYCNAPHNMIRPLLTNRNYAI